ncbi:MULTISPECIES: hypothetical protein [Sphaerospermopsis]|jgi:hypothetical protein|nr:MULTISPECIES: hypothetical protein [Sphaerospermopsis]
MSINSFNRKNIKHHENKPIIDMIINAERIIVPLDVSDLVRDS